MQRLRNLNAGGFPLRAEKLKYKDARNNKESQIPIIIQVRLKVFVLLIKMKIVNTYSYTTLNLMFISLILRTCILIEIFLPSFFC